MTKEFTRRNFNYCMEEEFYIKLVQFKSSIRMQIADYVISGQSKTLILTYYPNNYKSIQNCKIINDESNVSNFLNGNNNIAVSIPLNFSNFKKLDRITIICDSFLLLDNIADLNITFMKLIVVETLNNIKKIEIERIPNRFQQYFLFSQHSAFNFNYSRSNYFYLDVNKFPLNDFPFPDYREKDRDPCLEQKVICDLEQDPCPCCGAVLLRGMKKYFCCNGDAIYKNKLPNPNFPIEFIEKIHSSVSYNYPRKVNLDLRPEIHNAYISNRNASHSTIFINGLPYATSEPKQFLSPVYAVFNKLDKNIPLNEDNDIHSEIISSLLQFNPFLASFIREQIDNNEKRVGTISMESNDDTMQFALFNSEGYLCDANQFNVLRKNFQPFNISLFGTNYDKLLYPLIYWDGNGGLGDPSEKPASKVTTKIRRSIIILLLQSRNHFIHQFPSLREEYLCATFGRLTNISLQYNLKCQQNYFQREDEMESPDDDEKEYGFKSFVPPSFVDSEAYWKEAAEKCFNLSGIYGPPTFFLTITMNPYWIELQSLSRSKGAYSDSAMITLIFKQKLKTTMDFIKKRKLFGNLNAYVWRIEYQKRGLPHAHILFWTDFDTSNLEDVDRVVNTRYPKSSPFLNDHLMVKDMTELINQYQLHNHSSRCKSKDGICSFNFPQPVSDKTKMSNYRYIFARSENETMIVPHNPELLMYLRSHHCLEVISSDQCIGYILKYCTKNSDFSKIEMQTVRFRNKEITKKDHPLEHFVASRISSGPECFSSICGFWRYHLSKTVFVVKFHLEGKKIIYTTNLEKSDEAASKLSMLEHYFARPIGNEFDNLKITEYFANYIYSSHKKGECMQENTENPQYVTKRSEPIITVLSSNAFDVETYSLRLLLKNVVARSFKELRTFDGVEYKSFAECAQIRGLLTGNNNEAKKVINDALKIHIPPCSLRFISAMLIINGASLEFILNNFYTSLRDNESQTREIIERKVNFIIARIQKPSDFFSINSSVSRRDYGLSLNSLTDHQRSVAEKIIHDIMSNNNNLFFLQGRAGTGKTFTVRVIIEELRARGLKIAVSGTTGIAAVQFNGGTTLHSLFGIVPTKSSEANIYSSLFDSVGKMTKKAKFLNSIDLFVVDEISMLTPRVARDVSYSLKQIADEKSYFGGKKILFVGDLLQLPPVVPKSNCPVANRLIVKMDCWNYVKKFALTKPMRCFHEGWNVFLSQIATNTVPDSVFWESLPTLYGVHVTRDVKEAEKFYLSGVDLSDSFPTTFLWIAATNKIVNERNEFFQRKRSGHAKLLGKVQASTILDVPVRKEDFFNKNLQIDYIEKMDFPDLPPHELCIYKGDPFYLTRNIDTSYGLVKSQKCHAENLEKNVIMISIGDKNFYLTRLNLEKEFNGMKFTRCQIPIKLCYAATVHRSQGQTLDRVVLDLRGNFWEHGQMYVGLSRIKDPSNLLILLPESKSNKTEYTPIETYSDQDVVNIVNSIAGNECCVNNYISDSEITDDESYDEDYHYIAKGNEIENLFNDVSDSYEEEEEGDLEFSIPEPPVAEESTQKEDEEEINTFLLPSKSLNDYYLNIPKDPLSKEELNEINKVISPRWLKNPTDVFNKCITLYSNHHNYCYINSVLQVLLNIWEFRETVINSESDNIYITSLKDDISFIYRNPEIYNRILNFDEKTGKISYTQQDVSEFALSLFDILMKEDKTFKYMIEKYFTCRIIEKEILSGHIIPYIKGEIPEIFLNLKIAPEDKTLEDLFYNCFRLREISVFRYIKQSLIYCPKYLFLYVNRLSFNIETGNITKNFQKIEFEDEFDLFDRYSYQLYAVISHIGENAYEGHYVTYIRNEKFWYEFNDSMCSVVPKQAVFEDNFPVDASSLKSAVVFVYQLFI